MSDIKQARRKLQLEIEASVKKERAEQIKVKAKTTELNEILVNKQLDINSANKELQKIEEVSDRLNSDITSLQDKKQTVIQNIKNLETSNDEDRQAFQVEQGEIKKTNESTLRIISLREEESKQIISESEASLSQLRNTQKEIKIENESLERAREAQLKEKFIINDLIAVSQEEAESARSAKQVNQNILNITLKEKVKNEQILKSLSGKKRELENITRSNNTQKELLKNKEAELNYREVTIAKREERVDLLIETHKLQGK